MLEHSEIQRVDDKACRRQQDVEMKEGWSDRQTGGYELTWQEEGRGEQQKKKQNRSEAQRWRKEKTGPRNRVSKRTSESDAAGRWNMAPLVSRSVSRFRLGHRARWKNRKKWDRMKIKVRSHKTKTLDEVKFV